MANLNISAVLQILDRATAPLRQIAGGSSHAAAALKAAREQVKALQRQQGDINSFKQLSQGLLTTQNELVQARSRLVSLNSAIAASANPTAKMIRDQQRAQLAVNRLTQSEQGQTAQLAQLRQRLQQAGVDVNNLSQHEAGLAADLARANRAMQEQQERLRRLNATNQQYQRSMQQSNAIRSTGAGMVAGGIVAGAPIVKIIKDYASFEDAMLGVAKQVEGARNQNGQLTATYYAMADSIKHLATQIPLATNEIAAIVESGARMGIKGKDNLLTFAKTTATVATAFDLPVDQVGEDMAKIADLYKVPIKNISQLGDVINYLDDNTLSKGSEIIDVMKRIAGVAASVGMSYKEAAALGSSFLSMGSTAEVSASAANAMIRELAIANIQPKRFLAGLDAIGLKANEVQDGMSKNATGTIVKVLEAIKKLPENKQLEVTTQLFGKEYGDDASKLANNLAIYKEQLALTSSSKANGSMDKEAQAKLQTLSAQWQILKNQLFNQSSELGSLLGQDVKEIVSDIGGVLKNVTLWVKANPELTSSLLKGLAAISILSIALGSLAIVVGSILVPFAMFRFVLGYLGMGGLSFIGVLKGMVTALRFVFFAIRGLLMINPVTAAITLLATAAYLIYQNWAPIKAFFINLWGGIVDYVRTIPSKFMTIGGQIVDGLWNGISSRWANFKKYLSGIGDSISSTVKDTLGIHSPSRVFAEIGLHTMTGLQQGLHNNQNAPLNTVMDLSKQLKQAATGVLLGTAMTTATATPLDVRPPLSPRAVATGSSDSYMFNITIHAANGMDEKKLASLVMDKIKQHEREKQSRQRASLTDID